MNEVRHVLTALKTPAKSSTLNSGVASVATATWYDVPTPIIVHCREFREETERDVIRNDEAGNRKRSCEDEMGMRFVEVEENTTVESFERDRKVGCSEKDSVPTRSGLGGLSLSFDSVDKASSWNNNEAEAVDVASRLNRVRAEVRSCSGMLQVNPESHVNERTRNGKRRSTTMELNATTTVKTDADGVPTISFSFLRADENDDEIVILEVDTTDQVDLPGNQLYDLPKSATLESNEKVPLEQSDRDKEINSGESLPVARQDLYDVPKSTRKDASSNGSREEEIPICNIEQENCKIANMIVSLEKKSQRPSDRTKRSTRSLKSGRRSYGASDSDGYDAGIASMSGSYSDPECPNEEAALSESDGSGRSKRLKLQKRRLGKAWGRMRSWLREERTRIGEVVNRHAKLQAVGALSPEVSPEIKRKDKIRNLGTTNKR